MPEWDLSDLYTSPDAPEVLRDLEAAATEAKRIKETYQGKLVGIAPDGAKLAEAIAAYERLSDLMGKLGSYAGLLYAANQADPARAKFYGDMSEKLTHIVTDLIFVELELNQIDESSARERRSAPAPEALRALARRSAQGKALPARGEDRAALHREGPDRARCLHAPLQRDHVRPALRRRRRAALSRSRRRSICCPIPPSRAARPPPRRCRKVFGDNVRLFTLITNTLAKDKEISDRWRGFKDVADSRHLANRVEAPVVDALVSSVRAAYPRLSHRYYAMKARWLGMEKLSHWDRNAPLPDKPERIFTWKEAENMVLVGLRRLRARHGVDRQGVLRQALDRRAAARRQGAGRILGVHRAVRASLCADELPGQAARCDDARP